MGLMRLNVHDRQAIPAEGVGRIHLSGADELHGELPWFGRAYFSGDQLVIERGVEDSGWVYVPWHVKGHGEMSLCTATLREREQPYQLEVELARGTVNRLRNQTSHWEMMGLEVPGELRELVLQATREFARAAIAQSDPAVAAERAQQAIATAINAMQRLAEVYAAQAIAVRRGQNPRIGTLLGIQLGSRMPDLEIARQLSAAFNLACARLNWREVESAENERNWQQADAQIDWAQTAGLRICGGPLLDFNDYGIPDWAYLWEGDFDSLRSFMLDHVRRTVKRYQGRVQLWQVAARMCHGRVLSLTEEQRLQIVAQAIAAAREVDNRTPVVISFDQPWGEYLANEKLDLAPLHFADALVRADLGLSGLGLEINAGYYPRGSSHYSPLALSRLIDYWSMLDLPLVVSLTVPSSADEDPNADGKIRVLGNPSDVTPTSQAEWIRRHVPILFAKAAVQVVLWNQLTDARPHEFPNGGVFDGQWEPKPALDALTKLRSEFLM